MNVMIRGAVMAAGVVCSSAAWAADYKVDASQGHLVVRTVKAGPAARLAHDHVIHASTFSGTVTFDAAAPEKAAIALSLPTKGLTADDPAMRKKFGLNAIPAGDAKDINENMHDEGQLNTARFKTMGFTSTSVARSGEGYAVKGKLELHGVTREVTFPAKVTVDGDVFRATGELKVKQSDFGITPYSAAFGMVKNADEITLVLDVVARAVPAAVPASAPSPAGEPAKTP